MRLWKGLDGVRLRGSGRRVAWGLVAREGLSGSYRRINGSGGVRWKGDGGVGCKTYIHVLITAIANPHPPAESASLTL